jgi:hypothetical protein
MVLFLLFALRVIRTIGRQVKAHSILSTIINIAKLW